MLTDEEKIRLRQRGLTEQDIEHVEGYPAKIAVFIRCLLRLQASHDPIRAATGRELLARFEAFAETHYDDPDASLKALEQIIGDAFCQVQNMDQTPFKM